MSTPTTSGGQHVDDSSNSQILIALNAVNCRLLAIKQRLDRTEEQLQGHVKPGSDVDEDSDAGHDVVIPRTKFLKTSKHKHDAVDTRLQELAKLNEQGKFKSQRGSNEQVTVNSKYLGPRITY